MYSRIEIVELGVYCVCGDEIRKTTTLALTASIGLYADVIFTIPCSFGICQLHYCILFFY
jgi:hypothetical protein